MKHVFLTLHNAPPTGITRDVSFSKDHKIILTLILVPLTYPPILAHSYPLVTTPPWKLRSASSLLRSTTTKATTATMAATITTKIRSHANLKYFLLKQHLLIIFNLFKNSVLLLPIVLPLHLKGNTRELFFYKNITSSTCILGF